MAEVLMRPHEKFSVSGFPLNSVFTYCVMWSDRLKKVLSCTTIAAILTSALIEGCIFFVEEYDIFVLPGKS